MLKFDKIPVKVKYLSRADHMILRRLASCISGKDAIGGIDKPVLPERPGPSILQGPLPTMDALPVSK
jgi:hypothetical protein